MPHNLEIDWIRIDKISKKIEIEYQSNTGRFWLKKKIKSFGFGLRKLFGYLGLLSNQGKDYLKLKRIFF